MKKTFLFALACAAFASFSFTSCKNGVLNNRAANDSTAIASNQPELHGDSAINRSLRFYAGLDKTGIEMNAYDSQAWDNYSRTIKEYINRTANTRAMVDSISRTDFADFRNGVDYVFYPFSGADFIYPSLIYPDADTYFLLGLEKTGTPISADINTSSSHYAAYSKALEYFFRASYFITKYMNVDFHNAELDGVCPVITMMMATADREIISIEYKDFDEHGNIIESDKASNLIEIKFFKKGSNHEQTLYYASGNAENSAFDPRLEKYLSATLPQHSVGCFLKAASYLMHHSGFSKMRDFIINNASAVVEDDSGIPYRYFTENFDVTLYGIYKRPLADFGLECYQTDLQTVYNANAATIHPLPFRIGYNTPSNWLAARRKK